MGQKIKIYDLKDPRQYEDEKKFWEKASIEFKLNALEEIRESYFKLKILIKMKSVQDFEAFIELLNKNEVKYLVVGGYAFAIHAYPRFTIDIDFLILTSKENVEKIILALKEFGFSKLDISSDDLMKAGKVIQLGNPPYRIDILTSIDGISFENAWKNKITGKYGNQTLYFISKEDLIINKKASGRKKDIDDLQDLIK
jgi:hypothetical protein